MKVKISNIKPNPRNPRLIKDSRFDSLCTSLREFPEMLEKRPLVCFTDTDGKFVVLGGNMRLKAAKEIGLKELPIMLADDWTAEQKDQFLIKDNIGFGEWNFDELQADWDVEQLEAWGLEHDWETEQQLEAVEDDFDATPPENPITVLGDLYEIGEHRLLCGDSTDSDQVARLMNGQKSDIVIIDPLYQDDYCDFFFDLDANVIVTFGRGKNVEKINNLLIEKEYGLHNLINLTTARGNAEDTLPACTHQIINVFRKKAIFNWDIAKKYCHWFNETGTGSKPTSIIMAAPVTNGIGYAPYNKPIKVISYIMSYTNENGIIQDLCAASGSSMMAAQIEKRKAFCQELEPKYCDVIVNRMLKLDPTLSVKRNGIDCKNEFLNS
jgi:DNA modification methylase